MGVDLFANLCFSGILIFFAYCFIAAIMGWNPNIKKCKHCGQEFYVPLARYRGDTKAIQARLVYRVHMGGHKQ